MSILTKLFKTIYYVFIVFIATVAVLLVVSVFPITGNFRLLIVQSGSMEPDIKMGSIVVVKPAGDYKIGDVITFGEVSKTKTPITHRIYEIKVVGSEPVYITKGDANNAPDQREIAGKDIIGKVLFDIPYIGYAVDTAKKSWGFAIIIIVPALLIIFDEARKIFKEIKNLRKSEARNPKSETNPNDQNSKI